MEVADRQSDVIERGQRVAVFGLKAGQTGPPGVISMERLPLS